jgi:hypothetical protein
VEGADPHAAGPLLQERAQALAHLAGGLVGEGDREHVARVHALVDEAGDAVGEHTGLAGAGARQHHERALAVHHGRPLLGIEPVQQIVAQCTP